MGFSPGDFVIYNPEKSSVHWEAKDHYIVLWNEDESKAIFRIEYVEARKALDQLSTAIFAVAGEPPE